MIAWIAGLAIVALCVGALIWYIRKMQGFKADVDAARAEFLQKVGYEYVSALTLKSNPVRRKNTPQGGFTHYFETYSEAGAKVTVQAWELDCPKPSRTSFQIVEKKMVGVTRALLNMVSPVKRTLTVAYPGPHPMGDPELDARLALYANDAASAVGIVRQPEFRKELLEMASVNLRVDESGATFCDPTDANVYAWGASRTDLSPATSIRSAARVHVAVERLLRRAVGGNPDPH